MKGGDGVVACIALLENQQTSREKVRRLGTESYMCLEIKWVIQIEEK